MSLKLIFLGAPGSGKGTQAEYTSFEYNIPRLATGDIVRGEIRAKTSIGKKCVDFVHSGNLVPDDLISALVEKNMSSMGLTNGILFDGFPRTLFQAKKLSEMLSPHTFSHVIYFDISLESIIQRISGRRICLNCQRVYHLVYTPSKISGECDACGGQLTAREEDTTLDRIKKRFRLFEIETKPLLNYYDDLIVTIDANQTRTQVFDQLKNLLN